MADKFDKVQITWDRKGVSFWPGDVSLRYDGDEWADEDCNVRGTIGSMALHGVELLIGRDLTTDELKDKSICKWTIEILRTALQVGDIVAPTRHIGVFRSGASSYECAVVVSLEPFALVSVLGDMLWTTTIKPEDVRVVCKGNPEEIAEAMKRWQQECANGRVH